MQTASVVIVSLFLGALFIVILGGMATLIVLHLKLKKSLVDASDTFVASVAEMKELVAGARTSFGGIRQDIKTSLTDHGNLVADTLAKHEAAFQEKLGKINGAALEVACARAVKASNQIVGVATFLQKMLAEGSEPGNPENLPPEEYGPAGDTIYTRRSHTAVIDDAAMDLDNLDVMSDAVPAE